MRRLLVTLSSVALAATTLAALPSTQAQARAGTTVTNGCLRSVPDPSTDGKKVKICYTIFKPAGASRDHQVPFLMHSHGWGGSRTTDPAAFQRFLDAGYGVMSFDQRGFGESGGDAWVENPRYEGKDNLRLINLVAHLPWVQKDGPGDPRLGAMGGSYGGGYQLLGAFMEIRKRGKPVYDALAPQITWYDLKQSLAPRLVTRGTWASLLSFAAQPSQALPPVIEQGFAEGMATNTWPSDLDKVFRRNGPRWNVAHGRHLTIPVLFGQGTTDSLFELRQGFDNWQKALTPAARAKSIFIGYNGGHVLPKNYPAGRQASGDPCSQELGGGSFDALSLKFFDTVLKGQDQGLTGYGQYHLATPDNTCTTVSSVAPNTTYDVGQVTTSETGGTPLYYPVAQGPLSIAGSSYLTADVTALGTANRAFYGLATGTSPADAKLVQNNTLPINVPDPVTGKHMSVRLPAGAIDVPAGQTLYLVASPADDVFVAASSRTPGAIVMDNTVVHLPVVQP